jgi:FMN reductase
MSQERRVRLVVVTGNASAQSRSKILGDLIASRVQSHLATDRVNIEIGQLVPEFGAVQQRKDLTERVEQSLQQIEQADLLVVVTPVYKGSYTGHFKHLFDLVDASALVGTPVALVVEHQLRPLFGFFQAQTLPTAVYASEAEFEGNAARSQALLARIEALATEAVERIGFARLASRDGDGLKTRPAPSLAR